jgi:hypothetical protein
VALFKSAGREAVREVATQLSLGVLEMGESMNDTEAVEVARIVSMADGGCSSCIGTLEEELQASFPQFEWKKLLAGFWNGERNDE